MLQQLLDKIPRARVLVVGDSMLDRYWHGGVERISPEAPVPVIAVTRSDERAGGAANVARNVRALGAQCMLLSIAGDDRDADALQRLLEAEEVGCQLHRDKLVNTTVKLRVISRNQQLLRIDFEAPASKDARVKLLDHYLTHLDGYDLVIVSDYGKGGLGYVREMISAARTKGISVVVDPKGDDYSSYRGATLITPNRREFELVAGRARDNNDLVRKASAMIATLELDAMLITRGEEGMSLVDRDGSELYIPARAREVFDVTGAGDSVIATVGCALAVGAKWNDALQLANVAASIVVGKLGTAIATPREIIRELDQP